MTTQKTTTHRELRGTVVSDKMAKTVVVRVDRMKVHPKYKKQYRTSLKLHAHDEKGEYKTGDVVVLQETRPLSKTKRWRIVKKIV